jgi:pimeloyl-ACP methyl ester carboxylesterase
MEFFDDPLFRTFLDRAAMTVTGGGAEWGECRATARRIGDGDRDGWHREWTRTAATVEEWAVASARAGHHISAREAYLRACTYHRIAYYPLFGTPVDPRLTASFDRSAACFDAFAALCEPQLLPQEITYEGTTLPGFLCPADDSATRRPLLIAVNGYDSTLHEMYWSHALPALRRGYHCLLVDGPGQGGALIRQGLHLRPDWENVLRPVVDHALTLPGVDEARLAVMGWSLGGYLAPRGASGEPRIAALIADPGQWDQLDQLRASLPLPDDLRDRLPDVAPAELEPHLAPLAEYPVPRWKLTQRALWVHGLATLGEYVVDAGRYRLSDVVGRITCPTFVATAEDDPVGAAAATLYGALDCPRTLVRFTEVEGAADHTECWNRSRFTQRVFDWLDEVLET